MSNIIILFIIVPILAFILLLLNLLLAPHKPDEAKNSAFECGFSAIYGQTRTTFHIHFYVVAMLFLVFDLELVLLYPLGLVLYQISTFGFIIGLLFFTVLTIGFILEIGTGAISIKPSSIKVLN
jgi:NADH-ubiquinone oxidoreductase chain 3